MSWENFYLICFLVGFALTLLSFLLGSLHMHVHVPHGHGIPHVPTSPPVHAGAPHTHPGGGHAHAAGAASEPELSWFNFGTVTAFLAWFGGTGYLLSAHSALGFTVTLLLSVAAGVVGGSLVFWFIVKVLLKHDRALDPHDFEMVGVVGTVSSPIREGGTGEIVFSQEGVRRCAGARSEDGRAIAKKAEVVVTRYERGIAYVRVWDEFARENRMITDANSAKS